MVNKNKNTVPPSREVRLEDGVLFGDVERIAFSIYTGDAGTLANSMVELELIVELQRSKAIEAFKTLLRRKLAEDGYIVPADLDRVGEQWHEADVMGEADNLVHLDDYRERWPDFPPEAA